MGVASANEQQGDRMGRIAESAVLDATREREPLVWTNKVDRILDSLDDDDRAVVLSWLRDPLMGPEVIEDRLFEHGIQCSDTTVLRWRRAQAKGKGRVWVA